MVKDVGSPTQTVSGVAMKSKSGAGSTSMSSETESDAQPFVTLSQTVYSPAVVYVCCGLSSRLVVPSPKSHHHWVEPMLSCVKSTVSGSHPVVGLALKNAVTVFGSTVMVS